MSVGGTKISVGTMTGVGPGSGMGAAVVVGSGAHPIHPVDAGVTADLGGTAHPGGVEDGRCSDTVRCVVAVRRCAMVTFDTWGIGLTGPKI